MEGARRCGGLNSLELALPNLGYIAHVRTYAPEEQTVASEKSVIIIGAGLAGLSAGCYAQMNGYKTHIFEHHSAPGGVAASWKKEGYLIDGGIHFLMNHRPGSSIHKMYEELGAIQASKVLDIDLFVRFKDEASGRSIDFTKDLDKIEKELVALSPGDRRKIHGIFSGARKMSGMDSSGIGGSDAPQTLGVKIRNFVTMLRFLRLIFGKYGKPMSEYARGISDPWLRFVLENMFLPEVPVWFDMMFLQMLAENNLGILAGGSQSFVHPIEQRYKDLGGEVTYRSTVEKILVQDNKAVGIRLEDGTEYHADLVVSAADGHSTIFEMLGGKYVDDRIKDMYDHWKLIRPTVMINYGVALEMKESPWLTLMRLKQPIVVGKNSTDMLSVRIFNYSDKFAPPGKTVVQACIETEWDFWNDLRKDEASYEAEKERIAQEVLLRLESTCPGISPKVEVTDASTPFTTWRYTRNYKGAYMGWLPEPKILLKKMRNTLPGLEGFYLIGQWATPGGSVPTSLSTGRGLVKELCKRDGKTFVARMP